MPVVLFAIARLPIAVLFEAVFVRKAPRPTAVFCAPPPTAYKAESPTAVFIVPFVTPLSADMPTPVFNLPELVAKPASKPK